MNFKISHKKTVLFSFLCALVVSVHALEQVVPQVVQSKKTNIVATSKKDTVIAFDAHDVLLNFDKKALMYKIVQYGAVAGATTLAAATIIGTSAVWLVAAMPAIVVGDVLGRVMCFKKKHKRRPVIEHVWDADCLLKSLKPEYIRLESLFKPNKAMFKLIDELKEKGYAVVIASNIAPDTLKLLQERYPKHFEKFDDIESPNEENKWVDKRQPKKFFTNLKKKASGKKIILIDDKEENCKNAEEEELAAICFKGNMQELRKALQEKGVELA